MASKEELIQQIDEKLSKMDQDTNVHLEGLLWSKPITYWDYINTETLLSLQKQRTTLPDEMIFIMYHQVNELLFKMALWEADQINNATDPDAAFLTEKISRMTRYFDVLSSSFSIMGQGMSKEQYLKFRTTLTPASGFQSAQYRFIEFASTDWKNLADVRYRNHLDDNSDAETAFNQLYWQAAGTDHQTGKRTTLIKLFEDKYKEEMIRRMNALRTTNIWARYNQMPETERTSKQLVAAMRDYDEMVNIKWVMAHFHAAEAYLDSGDTQVEGTGGSKWKEYMHPSRQKRIFFPGLWSEEEKANWGKNER